MRGIFVGGKGRSFIAVFASVLVSVLVVTFVAQAATTISTNISTGGTLAVTGVATMNGVFQASSTALLGGAVTTYGNLTINKEATTTLSFSQAGINFDSNTFVIDPNSNRVGILTSTPATAFDVFGEASTTDLTVQSGVRIGTGATAGHITALGDDSLLVEGNIEIDGTSWFDGVLNASSTLMVGSAAGTNSLFVNASNGRVGIGSTTPYVELGVTGTTTSTLGAVIGSAGTPINQILVGTCSVNLPAMVASTTAVATCTATGVAISDKVFVTPNSVPDFVIFTGASSTAASTIQVSAFNIGSTTSQVVNPDAATWSWMAIR